MQTDVHIFDGKLKSHSIKTHLSRDQKIKIFDPVVTGVSKLQNFTAVNGLKTVIDDLESPKNYDSTNEIYADDILAEICLMMEKHFDQDIINTIIENIAIQMADMITLGPCQQGRATRLFQVYNFVKEIRNETPVGIYLSFNELSTEIKVNIIAY